MPESERDRERMDRILERLTKNEGALLGHEDLCAERYGRILDKIGIVDKSITETREDMAANSRIYMVLASLLFLMEFGRATFPAIFDLIMKFFSHGVIP